MIKKNLSNNLAFTKSLATAQKNKSKCTTTYQKSDLALEYGVPYPMVVTDITENTKGYVFQTDVFVDDKPVNKGFFFSKNPDTTFLSDFIDTVTPNGTQLSDVIGVPFEGEVKKHGVYTNMSALGLLEDEEDDCDEEEE